MAKEGSFDIILLDLNLPDSNGLETLASIRSCTPRIPIIILTSMGGEELALNAVSQGAQDYLFKDRLDPYWVAHSIRHAISRHELVLKAKDAEEREIAAVRQASQFKTDFLAAISHEIRTPLGAIQMASQILIDDCCDPEDAKEMGTLINKNAGHLLALVNDILDISKVEAGCLSVEKEAVDLSSFLKEIIAGFIPLAASKGTRLNVLHPESIPLVVYTDSLRLRQILSNLLSNALKFAGGGEVTLKIEKQSKSGPFAFEVRDSGIGMTEAEQETLFKPFSQADRSIQRRFGGTGLGLSLSKKLADALDGRLELSWSTVGVGTAFTLYLP